MQSADKKYFLFNKGINTEAPLVGWPEGFTIDEQNFDLLVDGSRRRRPGLSPEVGGTPESLSGSSTDASCGMRPFRWADAGQVSGNNFVCLQVGSSIYFWYEPTSGALGTYDFEVNLTDHIAGYTDPFDSSTYSANSSQLRSCVADFAQVNGKLVVVAKHLEPILIEYDSDNQNLEVTRLLIKERDLFGIEDGIDVETEPTTLTNSHEYNLWNRGWSPYNINEYFTTLAKYPSKNMIHFKGMRRQVDAATADEDGTKLFVPAALEAELFQNMSAPQGHAIREVFNRRNSFTSVHDTAAVAKSLSNISVAALGSNTWACTITTPAAHGLAVSDIVVLSGLTIKWENNSGDRIQRTYTGSYTVTATPSATTFKITIAGNDPWTYIKTVFLGTYTATSSISGSVYNEDDSAAPIKTRFTACASFASRIFYAGCDDARISNRVYFSKLVEVDTDLNRCFQEADPTSEFISDLIATDGGYVVLPEAGTVVGMMPFGASLIVFCTNGVWEIGPGQSGFFSALGYSVKKMTDIGCVSPRSIVNAGGIPMYWGQDGVYAIQQDPNSGYTTAVNVTKNVINGLYNSIRFQEKTRSKGVYDVIRQRIMWLYNSRLVTPITATPPETGVDMVQTTPVTPIGVIDDSDTDDILFDSVLVLDMRLGAWTRWVLGDSTTHGVRDIISMPANYITDNELRIKVFTQSINESAPDPKVYTICEFIDNVAFEDNGAEPAAFVYSGPDSLGEPERLRSAPYVHVFMRRIENSSLFMQPRFDWARGSNSGKIGSYVQVYRETRPSSEAYGLIVTKNKVLGRGRNLFLAFSCEPGCPAWLDGWTIKSDVNMRI